MYYIITTFIINYINLYIIQYTENTVYRKCAYSGEHLYAHFLEDEHIGLEDLSVKIIDVTNVSDQTAREGFWIEKLKCYAPLGLNVMEV